MTICARELMAGGACALVLVMALAGCANDDNVEGHWCGNAVDSEEECIGDEVSYLELTQSGETVEGVRCEAYQQGCCSLENGRFDGETLTFRYTYLSGYTEGSFTLHGDTLTGTYYAHKYGDLPVTLHRIE